MNEFAEKLAMLQSGMRLLVGMLLLGVLLAWIRNVSVANLVDSDSSSRTWPESEKGAQHGEIRPVMPAKPGQKDDRSLIDSRALNL